MPLVIELPAELETALTEDARALGRDPADLAIERLSSWYESAEPEAVAAIRRGLAAAAAGDEAPFEEYVFEVMEKRRLRGTTPAKAV